MQTTQHDTNLRPCSEGTAPRCCAMQPRETGSRSELSHILQRHARRQEALRRMADDLRWLISCRPGTLTWLAPRCRLAEMVHLVWMQRTLISPLGCPYTRRALAVRAFAAVGQTVPASLPRVITRLQECADPSLSMAARYEQLIDETNIISHFIKTTEP